MLLFFHQELLSDCCPFLQENFQLLLWTLDSKQGEMLPISPRAIFLAFCVNNRAKCCPFLGYALSFCRLLTFGVEKQIEMLPISSGDFFFAPWYSRNFRLKTGQSAGSFFNIQFMHFVKTGRNAALFSPRCVWNNLTYEILWSGVFAILASTRGNAACFSQTKLWNHSTWSRFSRQIGVSVPFSNSQCKLGRQMLPVFLNNAFKFGVLWQILLGP